MSTVRRSGEMPTGAPLNRMVDGSQAMRSVKCAVCGDVLRFFQPHKCGVADNGEARTAADT